MRIVSFFTFCCCLLACTGTSLAQTNDDLEGTYVRFKHLERGEHVQQVLKLEGATAGRYTLTVEGGDEQDYTKGYWKSAKIYQRRRDSLQVVILSYENVYNARYYEVELTGCLTPVDDHGFRFKRENAYIPVKRKKRD